MNEMLGLFPAGNLVLHVASHPLTKSAKRLLSYVTTQLFSACDVPLPKPYRRYLMFFMSSSEDDKDQRVFPFPAPRQHQDPIYTTFKAILTS